MIRKLAIFIVIQFSFLYFVMAQPSLAEDNANSENDYIASSLDNLGNPFISLLPKIVAPPVVIQPKIEVKPVEIPKPKPQPKPKPPVVNAETLQLVLTGMVWGEAAPQAIISDKLVGIGDLVHGAKVIAISQKGVELSYKAVKIKLTIKDSGSLNSNGGKS